MKNNNDYRWIPRGQTAWDIGAYLTGAISAEDLLMQYATAVAYELSRRGSSANVDEMVMANGPDALPIVQIG